MAKKKTKLPTDQLWICSKKFNQDSQNVGEEAGSAAGSAEVHAGPSSD